MSGEEDRQDMADFIIGKFAFLVNGDTSDAKLTWNNDIPTISSEKYGVALTFTFSKIPAVMNTHIFIN